MPAFNTVLYCTAIDLKLSTTPDCTLLMCLCSGLWVWQKCTKRNTRFGAGEGNAVKTKECKSLLAADSSAPPYGIQHSGLHDKATAPEN